MKILKKRNKEGGFIVSSELVLLATLLVIGLTTGLHGLKYEVNEEILDVAQAIGTIDQSYAYTGLTIVESAGGQASTSGSGYDDGQEAFVTTVLLPQNEVTTGITGGLTPPALPVDVNPVP